MLGRWLVTKRQVDNLGQRGVPISRTVLAQECNGIIIIMQWYYIISSFTVRGL